MAGRRAIFLLAGLLGCSKGESDSVEVPDTDTDRDDTDVDSDTPPQGTSIVVMITFDTLSATAANEVGMCAHLQGLVAPYGLELACLEGGISPSSWTGESVLRLQWPQYMAPPLSPERVPNCDTLSIGATIAQSLGGTYILGSDNPAVGSRDDVLCSGVNSWTLNTDHAFVLDGPVDDLVDVAYEDRPATQAIDEIVAQSAVAAPVFAYVNFWEVGGHLPRCWQDPYTESCEALWQRASAAGLADGLDDRAAAWRQHAFVANVYEMLQSSPDAEMDIRGEVFGTVVDSILANEPTLLDQRLVTLLDGLQANGRLDDLVLVISADHGESPCEKRVFNNALQCNHGALPTPYVSNVPAYVVPASLADDWAQQGLVGAVGVPWSTVNMDYGVLDAVGVEVPSDWPAIEAPGSAASWNCDQGHGISRGTRVVGNDALLCENGRCTAIAWSIPVGGVEARVTLDEVPASLQAWDAAPTQIAVICGTAE